MALSTFSDTFGREKLRNIYTQGNAHKKLRSWAVGATNIIVDTENSIQKYNMASIL